MMVGATLTSATQRTLRPWGGDAAWTRADTDPAAWTLPPDAAARIELEREAPRFGGSPVEATRCARLASSMPASAALMRAAQERLDRGPGVVVLDDLPLSALDDGGAAALGGMLCALLAPVVAQTHDGVRLYDVCDTGREPGPGVRRSLTRVGQPFHTDGPWVVRTAQYVALLCVRPGTTGGVSRLASLAAAHDRLLDEAPELLARLYGAFWWDRQREHGPAGPPVRKLAVFETPTGAPRARHYADYVRAGYRLAGETIDDEGDAALAALDAALEDPASHHAFTLCAGQMLIVNNRRLVHARTAFEDASAGPGPRRLVRVWMRADGGPALDG